MERHLLVVAFVGAALTALARAAIAQSESVEQAAQRLQATLAAIPHLNETDLLSDERGPRYAAARTFVLGRQCASRTANPLLAIAHPTGLSLRGAPVSGDPARAAESLELSLRVAALSDVPNEYLKNVLALMESRSLPAEVSAILKQEIPEAYKKLVARTSALIIEYNTAQCGHGARQESATARGAPFVFVVPTY